jgi:two-component sensor histidine kinase/tetratricopeptide (TPR) repeat protein
MIKGLFGILIFLLYTGNSFGQTAELDSLRSLYEKTESIREKTGLAIEMALNCKKKEEAIAYAEVAEELSLNEVTKNRIEAVMGVASVYYKFKDFGVAVEKVQSAVKLLDEFGSLGERAEGYRILGKYQRGNLMLDQALTSYLQAEEIYRIIGDTKGVINCLNKRGIIHKDLQNYSQALPIYYEAFDLARKHGLPEQLASTCVNIGVVLKNEKNFEEALSYYQRAEEIYVIDNNYYGLANIYNNIGNVLRYQKKYKEALRYYEFAIENRKKSKKLRRLGYTYNNIGIVYTEQKKYKLALEYLEKAEKQKLEFEDYETLAHTYLNFSEVYLVLNNAEKYYYYADLSEKLSRKYLHDEIIRNLSVNHGKFEANNGNYKKAYAHLSSVFQELDTLDAKSQKILTSVLQAHFREKQSKSEISELSEANDTLSNQKEELEYNQRFSRKMIWALSLVLVVMVILVILLFVKQRALAEKKKELELTNERLRETTLGNEEKETLLKEIHHRVKNNLQIIKSLIRLQNSAVEDEKMHAILLEFEQRVSSMALVHESLYKSDDLAKVNVGSYYEDLINDLIEAYNVKQEVEAEISIDIEDLGLDTLVPLGLLTNEIISNSLKHGFDRNTNGIIKVVLKNIEDGRFQLLIGDNGKGFDFEKQRLNESSLGTELILALVEQLDGEYEFSNDGGSYYQITFKPQDKTGI